MKWIFILLLFISGIAIGQTEDSTKYIHYKYQYGSRMPRFWSDSANHIPYGDTALFGKPQLPGHIMMHTDKNVYKWDSTKWVGIGAATQLTDTSFIVGGDTIRITGFDGGITQLTGDVTAGPGSGSQPATIPANVVTNAKLAQAAALTVKGNPTNGTANVQDIAAATDNQVLRRSGTAIGFGSINLASSDAVGSSILPVANGGTGTATPALVEGTNITITGSWPNQTINSTGGSGISGLTAGRVTLSTSATTIGDDAGLTYNSTTNEVTTDSVTLLNIRINEDPFVADSIRYHGTSITSGTGQSTGNRYATLTSNKLNSLESNFGISGASLVVQGVANIPTLPVYSRPLYRWIVLEWGVNDINSATDSATFDAAYRSYIDTLIIARGWPADRIVILAPSYLDPVLIPTATLAKQAQFRGATQAIATAKGTKWVDIYSAQLYRNPSNLLTDGIHPNDYGAYIYVNAITNTIGDSVMSTNQNISINGITELQRLKLRTVDTANYKSAVIGMDSAGNIARYTKDQIIQNSTTLLQPQGASISLVGSGNFGNVSSPNSLDKLQVNGAAVANGYRATGSEPSGETGSYVGMFYASDMGFIYARELPANTAKNITIAPFGGTVMMGTSTASGGTERLNVSGGIRGGFGHFTGALGTLTGSGVEIGTVSGSGYIGAYNRTGSAALPLTVQLLGGNMMVGTNTDGGEKFQVAGTVAFDLGSDANYDVYYRNSGGSLTRLPAGTDGYQLTTHSTTSAPTWEAASSATTIYNADGTLAGDRVVTGNNLSLTFDDIFAHRINSDYNVIAKANGTGTYTESIVGTPNAYWLGYTPTAGTFSKGAGVFIDTNNNVGLGTQPPVTMPLYATGASTFVQGLQSNAGIFPRVDNVTTTGNIGLTNYFITVDATAGNVTLTLPAASTAFGNNMGIKYVLQRIDASANTVTVQRAGSDVINGGTSFTLGTQWEKKDIQCTSTSSWATIERVAPKIYTALISQSGTSDPTVTVLGTNEIGAIAWARSVTGVYTGTLTGAFAANKTWCASSVSDEALGIAVVRFQRTNDNVVTLYTSDNTFTAADVYTNISIRIEVYP